MSRKLTRASAIAVAASMLTILVGANGSGALAQISAQPTEQPAEGANAVPFISNPVIQAVPATPEVDPNADAVDPAAPQVSAASLAELVAAQPQPGDLSREMHCLAGAIYFESKGESLTGQLAVGRVVVARSKSGRFPNSYCGVVFQRSQFSFVRGNSMPPIARGSRDWRDAVAVAQIAHAGTWRSPVEGALFFHAAYVSPGWRLHRVGRIENHIFYR